MRLCLFFHNESICWRSSYAVKYIKRSIENIVNACKIFRCCNKCSLRLLRFFYMHITKCSVWTNKLLFPRYSSEILGMMLNFTMWGKMASRYCLCQIYLHRILKFKKYWYCSIRSIYFYWERTCMKNLLDSIMQASACTIDAIGCFIRHMSFYVKNTQS